MFCKAEFPTFYKMKNIDCVCGGGEVVLLKVLDKMGTVYHNEPAYLLEFGNFEKCLASMLAICWAYLTHLAI